MSAPGIDRERLQAARDVARGIAGNVKRLSAVVSEFQADLLDAGALGLGVSLENDLDAAALELLNVSSALAYIEQKADKIDESARLAPFEDAIQALDFGDDDELDSQHTSERQSDDK